MALCSQAFTSAKRSCDFGASSQCTPNKKVCLSKLDLNTSVAKPLNKVCFSKLNNPSACYSSSESDEDSDDQQSCYSADQARAKRRASSRMSFSVNNELSKAVSQYSDDDELELDASERGSPQATGDANFDCKLMSSPRASTSFGSTTNLQSCHGQRNSITSSFLPISDNNSSGSSTRKHMPSSDKCSRSKCFDYLVGAIDEAWARYCDAASYVEDETYGYNTPNSVATDEEDDYFGNTTDLTDYESDFEHEHKLTAKPVSKRPSMMAKPVGIMSNDSTSRASSTSKDPSSCQLQALKDRLIKAKYFLQDLLESDDYQDASAFWKRWDMIKYAAIELVEDDDDDEIIESTIDDLEDGRLFTN
ncbi:hypothetical protein FT662_01687 [Candidozyma haemuli var. vulneris]|uniref:Uncharacterized protein n=1 Tax=Candidozyma haemuli TaxID=45357 RepID=A0A2V1AXI1_9ASCO|nr:hypothetical protein CXQ85_002532 [[Candida] haemuloni]KAF3991451.1 hypothetical protein FT662_01687 [[Candida] haemuloni var. vulneris]PVH22810.1 hypothetical protein CXQ85_002532 [[Candida] haemuloni]